MGKTEDDKTLDYFYEKLNEGLGYKMPFEPTFDDLKKFSKIRLKKKRNLKKFVKDYTRYVTKNIYHEYWGKTLTRPFVKNIVGSVMNMPNLEPISEEGLPKGEIAYFDYKYEPKTT